MDKTREVAVITKDALRAKIAKGEALQLLNVLAPQDYGLGMIKGSLKIPLAELAARADELDETKEIVTYCADAACPASRQAAELLAKEGFRVLAYVGGIKEWTAAQLPVEEDPAAAHPEEANA